MKVKIKKLTDTAKIPTYATPGSACMDIFCDEDLFLMPQEAKAVSTGLIFEIPEGYKMQIVPRSGISLKTPLRIANSPAVIDSDFRAEVKVLLYNTICPIRLRDKNNKYFTLDRKTDSLSVPEMRKLGFGDDIPFGTFKIQKGERIAQCEIIPVLKTEFEEVEEVSDTERGTGGMGSTGLK